jgi:hypothetical protein
VPVRNAPIDASAVRQDAVWPPDVVEHVRKLYDAWNWRGMHSGSVNVVKAAGHVSLESLGSNERYILVLRDPRDDAVVRLGPSGPLDGILVDAFTGRTIRAVQYNGEPGLMTIDLPHDSRILLLAMRAASITPTQ